MTVCTCERPRWDLTSPDVRCVRCGLDADIGKAREIVDSMCKCEVTHPQFVIDEPILCGQCGLKWNPEFRKAFEG